MRRPALQVREDQGLVPRGGGCVRWGPVPPRKSVVARPFAKGSAKNHEKTWGSVGPPKGIGVAPLQGLEQPNPAEKRRGLREYHKNRRYSVGRVRERPPANPHRPGLGSGLLRRAPCHPRPPVALHARRAGDRGGESGLTSAREGPFVGVQGGPHHLPLRGRCADGADGLARDPTQTACQVVHVVGAVK